MAKRLCKSTSALESVAAAVSQSRFLFVFVYIQDALNEDKRCFHVDAGLYEL